MLNEKGKLQKAIENVENILAVNNKLTNFLLLEICREQRIEVIGSKNAGHLAHEIMEVVVNNYISKRFSNGFEGRSLSDVEILGKLKALEEILPPQSWRSDGQITMQQFSTPPQIAYLLARILNPLENELVLEPSAGTGSLAVWLKIAGCKIHVNELSANRLTFLELQGYHPTAADAEFLDDLLPEKIAPDAVLMNPPFSTSGGRVKNNDSNFGFRHIKSALARLKKGGRLVALLGSDTAIKTAKGRKFLNEIADEYDLRAVISLPANAFYKYGTNFKTCIVCIEKNQPKTEAKECKKTKSIIKADCRSLEECLSLTNIFD